MADLATCIPKRQKPTGPVETFALTTGATEARQVRTNDVAMMLLLRYTNGARGPFTTSQISFGRKNALNGEIADSKAAANWDSENPDHLWIGHRDAPNQVMQPDPRLVNGTGAAVAGLPGGHVAGFADSFHACFRAVYSDIAGGRRPHLGRLSRRPRRDAVLRRGPRLGPGGGLGHATGIGRNR